eukprot:Platyproteum_vivax@DN4545_c0_g1_i1.p1
MAYNSAKAGSSPRRFNDNRPKLDTKEWDDQIAEVDKKISDMQQEMVQLRAEIEKKNAGRQDFMAAKSEINSVINELDEKIAKLEDSREKIRAKISETTAQGRELKKEASAMKSRLGFSSEREIDDAIAKIEYRMSTNSFSLKEEKKLMAEIRELKNQKPMLTQFQHMQASSGADDYSTAPLKDQMSNTTGQLRELRDNKNTQRDKLNKLIEKRKKATDGVPQLIEERNKLDLEIKEQYAQRKKLGTEKTKKVREYNQNMMEKRSQQLEKNKAEKALREAQNELKSLEWELEHVEDELPYAFQTHLCEQAITYVKTLMKPTTEEKPSDNNQVFDVSEIAEGAVVLKAKKDRDYEYWHAPTKGKKKNTKTSKKDEKTGKLAHSIDTLNFFQQLEMTAPMSYAEVPACSEQLETKLANYKELQKSAAVDVERRQNELQTRIDALERVTKEKQLAVEAANEVAVTAKESAQEVVAAVEVNA